MPYQTRAGASLPRTIVRGLATLVAALAMAACGGGGGGGESPGPAAEPAPEAPAAGGGSAPAGTFALDTAFANFVGATRSGSLTISGQATAGGQTVAITGTGTFSERPSTGTFNG